MHERFTKRRELRSAEEVEEEEECEDEGEGEGAETWIDKGGGEEHEDHHAVKDFAARVDFDMGAQTEDECEAEG